MSRPFKDLNSEEIHDAVAASTSLNATLNHLDANANSNNRAKLRTVVNDWSLDTTHFTPVINHETPVIISVKNSIIKHQELTAEQISAAQAYVSCLAIMMSVGNLRERNNGNSVQAFISMPERYEESIEYIKRSFRQLLPNRIPFQRINHSTIDSGRVTWIELRITDKHLKELFVGLESSGKRKNWDIDLEDWQNKLIKKYPMHFLSGLWIANGNKHSSAQERNFYTINIFSQSFEKIVQRAIDRTNIAYEKGQDQYRIREGESVHVIDSFFSQEYSSVQKHIQAISSNQGTLHLKKPKHITAPLIENDEQQRAYASLLGLYLGDGHISTQGGKGVYRLTIYLDSRYPAVINKALETMNQVFYHNTASTFVQSNLTKPVNCTEVKVESKFVLDLFPQHGAGKKHDRSIALEDWQQIIIKQYPLEFFWGLFASDGTYYFTQIKDSLYASYAFSNKSKDINILFEETCKRLEIQYGVTGHIRRIKSRTSTNLLERYIGTKDRVSSLNSVEYFNEKELFQTIVDNNKSKTLSLNKFLKMIDENTSLINMTIAYNSNIYSTALWAMNLQGNRKAESEDHLLYKRNFTKELEEVVELQKHINISSPNNIFPQPLIERPSSKELHEHIWAMSVNKVAEHYGVTRKHIERWCEELQVKVPAVGHWHKKSKEK